MLDFRRGMPAIPHMVQFALDTDPLCLVMIFFKLIKGRIFFPSMLAVKLFEKSENHCPISLLLLLWLQSLEPSWADWIPP